MAGRSQRRWHRRRAFHRHEPHTNRRPSTLPPERTAAAIRTPATAGRTASNRTSPNCRPTIRYRTPAAGRAARTPTAARTTSRRSSHSYPNDARKDVSFAVLACNAVKPKERATPSNHFVSVRIAMCCLLPY